MAFSHQIDCFNINVKFWQLLGIWPINNISVGYNYYSITFVTIFAILYDLLCTINFYFLPRQLDLFIEEMLFYFTELAVMCKALTFLFMRDKIVAILKTLESDLFQPKTAEGYKIIDKAKKFNVRYWKIVAAVSLTSTLIHVLSPLVAHLLLHLELELPVCSFSFLSDEFKAANIYLIYFYQSIGMHFHMLYNLNIDTFLLGLMNFAVAQLDILNEELRKVTNIDEDKNSANSSLRIKNHAETSKEIVIIAKLNHLIVRFDEVRKYCSMIQKVFSISLFVQFSMASCIICVCLFRFILPAPVQYFIFLATYMFVMIIQILVPCWFGTRIMDKSFLLTGALYDCDWTSKSRRFKSNMQLFVERTKRPLTIIGWKMFPLSLQTFSSIMNSAYSFFTLLRHMQTRDSE